MVYMRKDSGNILDKYLRELCEDLDLSYFHELRIRDIMIRFALDTINDSSLQQYLFNITGEKNDTE